MNIFNHYWSIVAGPDDIEDVSELIAVEKAALHSKPRSTNDVRAVLLIVQSALHEREVDTPLLAAAVARCQHYLEGSVVKKMRA
jgi:hypothetical protein